MKNKYIFRDWDQPAKSMIELSGIVNAKSMLRSEFKDKKGKYIFENDIIAWVGSGARICLSVVTFEKGKFMGEYASYEGNRASTDLYCLKLLGDIKVIGNTYENPELTAKIGDL